MQIKPPKYAAVWRYPVFNPYPANMENRVIS